MKIDSNKLKMVTEIIEAIADSDDSEKIAALEAELHEITEKNDINAEDCLEYWSWTSAEELARIFLMPTPAYRGLNDSQISEIIEKIYSGKYRESETYFYLNVLEKETGLSDISDYIFYPDNFGLDKNADISEITAKILTDRKTR